MKRLQNRIAQSRWALPVTAVYGLLVTLAAGLVTDGLWLNFALLFVSTVMMAELNNANSLIRIYSRMVSCSFLVMTTMSLFLFRSTDVGVVQITFIGFLLFLFRAYQDQSATGWTFYAFLSLGIGSVVFPQALLFVPLLWVVMAVNVMCFSVRTLFASILGLVTPYWFVVAWLFLSGTGNLSYLSAHFLSIFQFARPFDFSVISFHQLLTMVFVMLLAAIGAVHFFMYSYQDRIRIRMYYEMFIVLDAFCFVFAIVQPQHFNSLLGMAIVLTSPLIGHYLALSHSRMSNVSFMLLSAMALAVTMFNLTA